MLTESRHGVSNLQLRDGSAGGPSGTFSNELGMKGASDYRNPFDEMNHEIEPLNLDMGNDDLPLPKQEKLGLSEFPSLRDLETSNAFTKSNLNIADSRSALLKQILSNELRKEHLNQITTKI